MTGRNPLTLSDPLTITFDPSGTIARTFPLRLGRDRRFTVVVVVMTRETGRAASPLFTATEPGRPLANIAAPSAIVPPPTTFVRKHLRVSVCWIFKTFIQVIPSFL